MILPGEVDEASSDKTLPKTEASAIYRAALHSIRLNVIWIAILFAVCLAAATFITVFSKPIYLATATIRIEPEAAAITGKALDEANTPTTQDTERQLQTQIDVALSRTLAAKVASELRLYNSPDFVVYMGYEKAAAAHLPLSLAETQRRQVEDLLTANLQVILPRGTRIAQIRFQSADPVLAAKIANSYAQALIASNIEVRMVGSQYAQEYLAKQLALTRSKLEDSEQESISYASKAGLIGTVGGLDANTPNLSAASLVQVSADHDAARSTRIRAEQTYRQAQNTPLLALPGVQGNQALQTIIARRTQLRAEVAANRRIFADEYPEQAKRLEELASLDSQVNTLARSSLVALRQDYRAAAGEESALAQQVMRLRGDSLSDQAKAVRYNILKREADTHRALYETLLARYNKIGAEAGATNNNISLLDAANIPLRPVSPQLIVNLVLAFILAAILSGGLILIQGLRGKQI